MALHIRQPTAAVTAASRHLMSSFDLHRHVSTHECAHTYHTRMHTLSSKDRRKGAPLGHVWGVRMAEAAARQVGLSPSCILTLSGKGFAQMQPLSERFSLLEIRPKERSIGSQSCLGTDWSLSIMTWKRANSPTPLACLSS